jgi:hypothetical protein
LGLGEGPPSRSRALGGLHGVNECDRWDAAEHGRLIITALLDAGMRLTALVEHDSVPWEALPGQMVADDAGEWRLSAEPERLAASYTLQAIKT